MAMRAKELFELHRHIGGLENPAAVLGLFLPLHRHIGGLEK